MNEKKKIDTISFGIITYPIHHAGITPLSHLISIISSIKKELFIISNFKREELEISNSLKPRLYKIDYSPGNNFLSKIVTHTLLQISLSIQILKLYKNVDVWIFFLNAHYLILPVLTAKILKKQIIFSLASSIRNSNETEKDLLMSVSIYSENFTLLLADIITVYSNILIQSWHLEHFSKKIFISHEHFMNFNRFKEFKRLGERKPIVGYIGRFSEEKGILNFINAIELLYSKENNITIFIGGDGPLKREVSKFCEEKKLSDRIIFSGWISHDNLPNYLNELKLLVVPSYSEGIPNIILEGMACGTPILATPVGAIPDIIKDSKTGFIMEDNSPECIVKNIIRALNQPELEQIINNAHEYVQNEFNFDNAMEKWKDIIIQIENKSKKL
jgi:glycosyltransferase involved in cell wall biosynthesis